jgi:hypothetical protein
MSSSAALSSPGEQFELTDDFCSWHAHEAVDVVVVVVVVAAGLTMIVIWNAMAAFPL